MKIYVIIISSVLLFSCKSEVTKKLEEETLPKNTEAIQANDDPKRFPNERSELAILMRNLNDELAENKQRISEGQLSDVDWVNKYEAITTATPTDSNDSGPVFHAFSKKFLADLEAFQESDSNNRIETFNAMIQSCLDCHQEHCHGPMVAIRKLKI